MAQITKRLLLFALLGAAFLPMSAHAACDAGHYGDNCAPCPMGYYCPGDGAIYQCPADTTDWAAHISELGLGIVNMTPSQIWSWDDQGTPPAKNETHCVAGISIFTKPGGVYFEKHFNGTDYWGRGSELWFVAGTGYYLSGYRFTSSHAWYFGTKQCTNAQANAHYTGPGTPDAPDGSIIDANDCPWECDAGYYKNGNTCTPCTNLPANANYTGTAASNACPWDCNDGYALHDGQCLQLCPAGVTAIKTSTGLSIPLFAQKQTTPALNVGYAGTVCYGNLAPNAAAGAININVAGQIYHTVQ